MHRESTNNNNHLNSDKDELPTTAAPSTEGGNYENINRHHSYHYHHQDTTSNNSCPSTYNGHTISGTGNSSSGHLMKRPEGTNRANTTEKGENRDNGSFSPPPENGLHPPLLCNSSSITSSVGAYPYLSSAHQSSHHQSGTISSLSSPLYGSYSTCGSIFASSKSFHNSSSSKSRSIKTKANSSGKKLKNLVCAI